MFANIAKFSRDKRRFKPVDFDTAPDVVEGIKYLCELFHGDKLTDWGGSLLDILGEIESFLLSDVSTRKLAKSLNTNSLDSISSTLSDIHDIILGIFRSSKSEEKFYDYLSSDEFLSKTEGWRVGELKDAYDFGLVPMSNLIYIISGLDDGYPFFKYIFMWDGGVLKDIDSSFSKWGSSFKASLDEYLDAVSGDVSLLRKCEAIPSMVEYLDKFIYSWAYGLYLYLRDSSVRYVED